jgi:hypothetical protein
MGNPGPKESASLLRKALVWVILVMTMFLLLEGGSALVLYHQWSTQREASIFPTDLAKLATLELGRRIGQRLGLGLPWLTAARRQVKVTSVPDPFMVPDAELGFTVRPGSYQIMIEAGELKYRFHAAVWPGGSRATSYLPHQANRRLYIFGDSWAWGWPNEDEQTFAWLLQQSLPDYSVLNFSQNGYGNVHGLIQLRRLRGILTPDDIVLLIYGDYFNARNIAAPSYMRTWQGDGGNMTYPRGLLVQGNLAIEYLPLFCSMSAGYCDQADPDQNQIYEVTKAVFGAIINATEARVVVGYISGAEEKDPVITFLRQHNIDIVDLRPSSVFYEMERLPFDDHPGPIGQYHFFSKILNYLHSSR